MHVGVCENGADVYGVPRSAYPAALKSIPIQQYIDGLERVELKVCPEFKELVAKPPAEQREPLHVQLRDAPGRRAS
jgi:hypothetical protein